MLRKKLKLSDQPEPEPTTAGFDYAPMEFALRPQSLLPITSPHFEPKPQFAPQPQYQLELPVVPPAVPLYYQPPVVPALPLWHRIYQLELQLCEALKQIPLPAEVAATYDPIQYAAELHLAYMQRFLDRPKAVLFLGMNPGPWGMCQTGVPFGHVPSVRDWMQLRGQVYKPVVELDARPVQGLACTRGEQSGQRWWGLYEQLCGTPENFFRNCFVWNICPLAFFHASGRNITPAELKGPAKTRIQQVCNEYLKTALDLFNPTIVVSVGRYTEDRVKALVKQNLLDPNRMQLSCMPHPSPRSLNNTNWLEKARQWLVDHGVMPYLQS
ncbi:hypothetical protein pipiens_010288 [Culex pipiens pipiens]|uniref:Uracil-DNA glycosylase-like domain-containing protein n=1 Tax=Culex pipiens pipiens TaxID=38569 RepID=A0ABD1DE80_CULPP